MALNPVHSISAVLLIASRSNDGELKSNMETLQEHVIQNDHRRFPEEILKTSDARTKSQICKEAIKMK